MEFTAKIIDPIGLHARPAAPLAKEAGKFKSDLTIKYNGKTANLKSILAIMGLAVKANQEITVIAKGSDEKEALESIERVMKENKLIA